jgi:hypothetical protein
MDEDQIADVLKSERLGHEEAGMRGVYGHVSQPMRDELKAALQARWERSIAERVQMARHSAVPLLDRLLTGAFGPPQEAVRSQLAPKSDIEGGETQTAGHRMPCDLRFRGRGGRI